MKTFYAWVSWVGITVVNGILYELADSGSKQSIRAENLNLPLVICIFKMWVLEDVMTSSFVDRYQCSAGTLGILSYPEDGSKMINQPSQDGNISIFQKCLLYYVNKH